MENKFYLSNEDYIKGVSIMIRTCVDFAIVKNKTLLLTKREIEPNKGMWHFPGGMVRKGESIKQAADRILTAELGLKPVSMDLVGFTEYLDEKNPEKGLSTHSVALVFKTTLEEGDMKESFQAKEMKFFDAIPQNTIPELKEFLEKNWSIIV